MIKRIAGRLLAAALTFLIGVTTSALWFGFQRQELSPCDSASTSLVPGRGLVRIRGMLYGSPDGRLTLNELECSGAWVEIKLDESFRADSETWEFIERLNNLAGGDRMSRAEVIVIGTLKTQQAEGSDQPFVISATGLVQAGTISLISMVAN